MRTTRRRFLKGMTFAASAGSLPFLVPRTSLADDDAELAQRLAADLARHAGFGDKFSGGPGDLATADWVAGRLRTAGYRVAESTFDEIGRAHV